MLGEEDLVTLAETCHMLEAMSLSADKMTSLSGLEQLCVANANLTSLTLSVMRLGTEAITTLLTNISNSCTHLKLFALSHADVDTVAVALHIFKVCVHIETVLLPQATLRIRSGKHGLCCDFKWVRGTQPSLVDFFRAFPIPIRSFEGKTFPAGLLGKSPSVALEDISLRKCFPAHLSDDMVIEISEQCPNLTTVVFCECINLTPAAFVALARRCPRLKTICLHSIHHIDDDALFGLWEACKDLKTIILGSFRQVTGSSLRKIVELLPNLITIGVALCAVEKEVILELILDRKLKARTVICDEWCWIEELLKEVDFHPIPSRFPAGAGWLF